MNITLLASEKTLRFNMFYLVESEMKLLSKVTKDDIPIEQEQEVKERPLGFLQSLFTRKGK